jgi:hypothetical protein
MLPIRVIICHPISSDDDIAAESGRQAAAGPAGTCYTFAPSTKDRKTTTMIAAAAEITRAVLLGDQDQHPVGGTDGQQVQHRRLDRDDPTGTQHDIESFSCE